ncbi:Hydroxymethylglutaryl-CoA lyase [Fulvivirga imtechensis AK7]|uniref:Hydroxymethylglutaryl-CoA lyase n=1 Tax=Fulvivirga imtechensis AK7 TaxID=1237149 RepID=L8K059_9BACT|nr:hydroxymethylglutaryl-CoA lyase [Fulvivirga imtechensis]ELR73768.1 Hydroxymethylglutaryl-CoA lyase [Fulvivirga imtechensis AK7]
MKIIECPRDAMQGIKDFIPTSLKAGYINQLLQVGFDTIDFGSFVSPKAIPQMKDTAEVLKQLDLDKSNSKLLAIVANLRGAEDAVRFEEITYLGFPFSISETFQQRNTNKSIIEALNTLNDLQALCVKHEKTLVSYISMGFGNPYGDPYDAEVVAKFTDILVTMGITIISLADTIGVSDKDNITMLYTNLIGQYPQVEFGAHLHSHPSTALSKVEAAYEAGCRRFDGAINGYGGCPMAKDDLVGNIATETIVSYLEKKTPSLGIDPAQFKKAMEAAPAIFDQFH